MSFETRLLWLKSVGVLLVLIGAFFAWTTTGPLAGVNVLFVDLAVFPVDGAQNYSATETRLLAAIVGGLTAGIGTAIYLVAQHVYAKDPALGRKIILGFVSVWFVVDSIGSVISGAAFNVVLNTSLLLLMLLPLVWAKQDSANATG